MDFSNSVILPREDFIELQTVAWNQPPSTPAERIATTLQTTAFCTVVTAAFSLGMWAWYKAMAKLEDKKLANAIYEAEQRENLRNKKV